MKSEQRIKDGDDTTYLTAPATGALGERPAETPEKSVDALIDQWLAEGTYIGQLISDLDANPDQEPDPVLDPLEVPRRPITGRASVGVLVFICGWLAWFYLAAPTGDGVRNEAMAGFQGAEAALSTALGPDGKRKARGRILSEEINFSGDAEPLPRPEPGDWLYEFPEKGQTFKQYKANADYRRTDERFILYVAPLGVLDSRALDVVSTTTEYLGAYYDIPTRKLPPINLPIEAFAPARGQYDARKVIEVLHEELPGDALGLVAVTDADLYIKGLNFVFGLGSARDKVAIYSIRRHGYDYRLSGERGTVLRRSMTVAVHETGHILSMRHCTAFKCIMNGTASLREADDHPLHLCPSCIKKAELGFQFEREHRYERLLDFYQSHDDFDEEVAFIKRRLDPPVQTNDYVSNL